MRVFYSSKSARNVRTGRKCVVSFQKIAPFKIVPAENGNTWVEMDEKGCSPQEISAMVLRRMKETAMEYVGGSVEQAVNTVPAYFNDAQRLGPERSRASKFSVSSTSRSQRPLPTTSIRMKTRKS